MTLRPLFPVTQQFQNKNGSNLVGGKVYVYFQGRTALATTYHDEDGTVVNTNPVLLDNNGRATVFADTIYSYTIVVCDYYGKELFSQDITLHDAISTAEDVLVIGSNGSVKVDTSTLPNGAQYDLSVNTDIIATKKSVDDVKTDLTNLTGKVDNHTTQIGQIQESVAGIETTVSNKKDKQTELAFNGSATKTVKSITQNANGELNVVFENIDLPQEVPNVEITSEDKSIKVSETTDVQTNTKKFDLSVQGGGTTYSAGDAIDLTNNTISAKYGKGLEITTDNKLQLKVGKGLTLDNDTLELTIKDLATSITDFRDGDVILVDGPSGTAKMSKVDLLKETAENALGSIHSLSNTATVADLVSDNYLAINRISGTKKLPANIILPILGNSNTLGITDANDAGVGVLLVNTTISHIPEASGILCTYGTSSTSNYLTQFYITTKTNNFYTRSMHGGTWVEWKNYDISSILPDFLCIVFDYFSISDVSTTTANKYVQATGYVGDAANFSMSQTFTLHDGESVFIYGGAYKSNVSVIAKYVGSATYYEPKVISTQSEKRGYYYTNESGSDETIVLSYSELRKPDKYVIGKINSAFKPKEDDGTPEFSVFETFGVIGDSYASGVIYNSAGTDSSTFYNKSWPQIIGRKNGINVTNYSFGGARTNTWLTNTTYGLPKLLSDAPLDAYAIVLSINDRNNGGAEWLGTIDDIHVGDPSLNADSFYGCYAKIIENVLSHAPNAKIFCVQHAYNETGLPKDYNDAISAIASLYNLPCVPEFEDSFFSSAIYTQMYGGHPTYVGYAGMADALCRLMRKAMVDYKDYFKQYVPIP